MRKEVVLTVLAAVLANPVMAGFTEPYDWQWEGEYGCVDGSITRQVWTFNDSMYFPGTALNPVMVSSPGSPTVTLDFNMLNSGWRQGSYYSSQELGVDLDIPNYQLPNPFKFVALVFGFKGEFAYAPHLSADLGTVTPLLDNVMDVGNGWSRAILVWKIEPNPTNEEITFTLAPQAGELYAELDWVGVYTNCCVPEPATCVLLGIGSLVMFRRKKQ